MPCCLSHTDYDHAYHRTGLASCASTASGEAGRSGGRPHRDMQPPSGPWFLRRHQSISSHTRSASERDRDRDQPSCLVSALSSPPLVDAKPLDLMPRVARASDTLPLWCSGPTGASLLGPLPPTIGLPLASAAWRCAPHFPQRNVQQLRGCACLHTAYAVSSSAQIG